MAITAPTNPAVPVATTPVLPNVGPALQQTNPQAFPSWSWQGQNPAMPFAGRDYNQLVETSLQSFLDPNSQYIQNARQRGMEVAATRGGINSSIAAGASERAAMEAAVPLAQTAIGAQLGQEQTQLQNWIDTQGFNRELAALPYQSSLDMMKRITEYSLQDPQLFTPSVISGYSNFFNKNMQDILGQYFNNG